MMTKATSEQQTDRQKLGAAIRFFRLERKMSQRDIADRVGVSVGEYDDWETGRHAPPENRWSRLVNMLHDNLREMRAMWQRALAEDAREREQAKSMKGSLTSKPFAGLDKLVAEQPPPPTLKVVPPPPPETPPPETPPPETLHDDGYDLRPAYKAVQKLPEGWNTAEAKAERWGLARKLVEEGKLRTEEIIAEVKRKFGVGISAATLTDIRAELQESKKRPRTPTPAPPVAAEVAVPPSRNEPEPSLRRRLRAVLARIDMTQHELAQRLGHPVSTVSSWLIGVAPMPSDLTARIERAIGLPAGALTDDSDILTMPIVDPMVTESSTPPVDLNERIDYVKMLLRKSPSMKIDGEGGLHAMLTRKFGVSLPLELFVQLQNEARAQRTTGPMQAVQPPAPAVSANDIEGAVRLILEAIPNLKSFKIDVDESGEVHVNHTIRVETSGTLKLKK